MSFLNLFGGDKNSNATSSTNTSNTSSSTDSHNTAVNTTNSSTYNATSTVTQDRRLVTDNGAFAVSADNSNVTTSNSNNSVTNNISYTTDQGAVAAGLALGQAGIASNTQLAAKTVDASLYLTNTGKSMLEANIAYAQHVGDAANAEARNAIREVVANSNNAINQVVGIASKPLNAQDPQHVLVIVGLVVVGAVLFSKVR